MCGQSVFELICSSCFLHIEFNKEYIFYHAVSGETHFLNATGASILKRLSASPARIEDLLDFLDGNRARPSCSYENLKILLERFEELGIIKCNYPSKC
ncbi:HPr-rel-A system PqqD family peptide chaperone [Allochromatium palmeri]|uniref:HPr-rel-A system PqqD family peptide chaperone n=1 Tax=Allochromatium palmeri TaxID=231048 RepID=A0A6N8EF73_9GAMM|nr:HPr-rel-A system PqqD family peptide chaperone [Allochromatium palmeri]